MKSLKALTGHLRSLQLINDDNFSSWVQDGEIEYSGAAVADGFGPPTQLLYRTVYTAIFSWESFTGSADELFSGIIRWLRDNDYDFDLYGMPHFTAVPLDEGSADVQVSLVFTDKVYEQEGKTVGYAPAVIDGVTVCGGG
ncbi:phage tail protein [Candidatus Thiothrix sp. Deng01]|uniref:Phage tail protein n=1 Tax=Candidatus Thiothrix phosphatis TaxID=3112415 RepID=A0ABU6CX26_9GAMM|nr:phage tail protein [Candidatus Thiothrix sp. Deng01]MEB4591386.1 phage tail protein [Candidatus Thiothrix sp. Deng01]